MEWHDIEERWDFYQQQAKRHWKGLGIAQLRAVDGKLKRLIDCIQISYRHPASRR